jgi:hypothetical protein
MAFPASGSDVPPEALNLADIDCETNQSRYAEDKLWIRHAWGQPRARWTALPSFRPQRAIGSDRA